MSNLYDARRYLSDFETARVGHLLTDVLVIGSGIAGARAGIQAANHGDVIVINKSTADHSATWQAQGGISSVVAAADSFEQHIEDTLRVGCGLGSHPAVELVVRQGPQRVEELIRWGAAFDRSGGELSRTREGGHSVDRVLHAAGDATGRELGRVLLDRLRSRERVRVFEHCFAIDLLTLEGRCVGAVTYHPKYGHQLIWAKRTILASGGGGQLYRETTNPPVATVDGPAAAYRAGAVLGDLELVQFHPTTLYIAGSTRALISEAVRGEGGRLVDRDGNRFMEAYHPDAEMAPRDVVSRAIRDHLTKTGGSCVYLDVRHIRNFAERFPGIRNLCTEFGIDVTADLIPVNPGAHYMLGGVVTDLAARTSVDGLFACGEAACVGVHGANRLPSNSLLEGLVFGAIAGDTAGAEAAEVKHVGPSANVGSLNPVSSRTRLDLGDVRNSLRSVMWRNVGVVRVGDRLHETVEIIEFWGRFVMDKTFDELEGWEVQNLLSIARLVSRAAELRPHSLGVHYRSDSPPETTREPPVHLLVRRSDEGPVFTRVPPDLGRPA